MMKSGNEKIYFFLKLAAEFNLAITMIRLFKNIKNNYS